MILQIVSLKNGFVFVVILWCVLYMCILKYYSLLVQYYFEATCLSRNKKVP